MACAVSLWSAGCEDKSASLPFVFKAAASLHLGSVTWWGVGTETPLWGILPALLVYLLSRAGPACSFK